MRGGAWDGIVSRQSGRLDRWEVPADGLGDVWIAPPDGFSEFSRSCCRVARSRWPVADRQTTTLEWASPTAPVPARQLTESTTLASISPIPVQLRDDQNYRRDATLSESHSTRNRSHTLLRKVRLVERSRVFRRYHLRQFSSNLIEKKQRHRKHRVLSHSKLVGKRPVRVHQPYWNPSSSDLTGRTRCRRSCRSRLRRNNRIAKS